MKTKFAEWFEERTGFSLVHVLTQIEWNAETGDQSLADEAFSEIEKLWERWCKANNYTPLIPGAIEVETTGDEIREVVMGRISAAPEQPPE